MSTRVVVYVPKAFWGSGPGREVVEMYAARKITVAEAAKRAEKLAGYPVSPAAVMRAKRELFGARKYVRHNGHNGNGHVKLGDLGTSLKLGKLIEVGAQIFGEAYGLRIRQLEVERDTWKNKAEELEREKLRLEQMAEARALGAAGVVHGD